MEIICNQNELNNAIQLVSKAVASRPTHPILAKEGVFCEPASAASVAGLIKNKNRIQKESNIVCVLTGNGLKDPDCAIKNNDAIF